MEAQSWSQRLKIVVETSGHPSRCRWTAGERASSRDARDSVEFSCRVIAQVFPNLRLEVILGTLWLIKENPDIDWVKPEVKLRRRGQLQVLPL